MPESQGNFMETILRMLQTAFATASIEPRGTAKAARIFSCTLGHANASEGTSRPACNNLESEKHPIQGLGLHKQPRVWNLGRRLLTRFHWRVHFPIRTCLMQELAPQSNRQTADLMRHVHVFLTCTLQMYMDFISFRV